MNNIDINGLGSINGGNYDNVEINGLGTINSDLICEEFSVNGKGKTLGRINTKSMDVNGLLTCYEDIEVKDPFEINGVLSSKGGLKGDRVIVNGRASFDKSVNIDRVEVNGDFYVGKDCECGSFYSDGRVRVKGLLSGDNIELNLSLTNEIEEIGGETLNVRKARRLIRVLFFTKSRKSKLISNVIEADDIYLEHTKCNVVRGKNIKIGDGCDIGKIEYSGELIINGNSKIREKFKV
ncbi:MAG: hypothetical protein E6248_09955 [Clostridium sp.]|uniref:hypothetical protein n=1 Tax=Clostridium sp. TaxID=1506 RepID=UPI001E127DD5|nr:hypothetical protein [Clostridium sp.]MBS5937250.1 hypothetical protein [Clostridium sp.]MDU5110761.1 hypothetical protein [Clostridium sp.]